MFAPQLFNLNNKSLEEGDDLSDSEESVYSGLQDSGSDSDEKEEEEGSDDEDEQDQTEKVLIPLADKLTYGKNVLLVKLVQFHQ